MLLPLRTHLFYCFVELPKITIVGNTLQKSFPVRNTWYYPYISFIFFFIFFLRSPLFDHTCVTNSFSSPFAKAWAYLCLPGYTLLFTFLPSFRLHGKTGIRPSHHILRSGTSFPFQSLMKLQRSGWKTSQKAKCSKTGLNFPEWTIPKAYSRVLEPMERVVRPCHSSLAQRTESKSILRLGSPSHFHS